MRAHAFILASAQIASPAIAAEIGHEHHSAMVRMHGDGSGTSLLPRTTRMRAWHVQVDDWMVMAHGGLLLGKDIQTGLRGAEAFAGENWQMLMASRELGPGFLDLRLMTSLEPFTLPPGGTPQLLQTGETYLGRPIVDRQHPHELVMEAAGRYTWQLSDSLALIAYGGPVAEPALGPVAFMHRPSAEDNHWAPLGHHYQDSTHISHGVVTGGIRLSDIQLEASVFNAREPDEDRIGVKFGPMDSFAGRLSYRVGDWGVFQVSTGLLVSPEPLEPGDVLRTTASWTAAGALPVGDWSGSLIWGQNRRSTALQSYAAEGELTFENEHHWYGRAEWLDRDHLIGYTVVHRVGALTLGWAQDLTTWFGVGGDVTVDVIPPSLQPSYGVLPWGMRLYVKATPPRI